MKLFYLCTVIVDVLLHNSGADPGAGKGGAQTGQVVDGWGEPDSLVNCCIFEAANNHLLVVSYC